MMESSIEFDPKSIVARKMISNDYDIQIETKNTSLWAVRVRNSREVLLGRDPFCAFVYSSTDDPKRNIVCDTLEELKLAVKVARKWIEEMSLANKEAERVLYHIKCVT